MLDYSREVWNEKEKITLEEAVYIYTKGSSFVNFLDSESGYLEVGKDADFIILDKNFFQIDFKNIHQVQVLATYVKGNLLYLHSD